MRHEAIKRPARSDIWARRPKGATAASRYDLAMILLLVRRVESLEGRGAVFEEIKAKNPLYRLVDRIYTNSGIIQPLLLFAYMLKCVVSVGRFDDVPAETIAVSNFENEHRTIDRLAALVPEVRIQRLSIERGHIFGAGQLAAAFRMIGTLGRVWSFLSTLARLHSFMPAARIASALAFYMRFSRLFAERPGLKAAIIASNYSPEAVGMAAAAHRAGRHVVYVNHASVPANCALVPPVLADCAVFYGEAVRKTYERRSCCRAEVALIGQPWTARPMQWREDLTTVGIFLTSLTRTKAVSELVSNIRATHPHVRILIRNHPVALLKSDFSELVTRDENLSVTIGNPLEDEIAGCDLIICGNSGVAMNAVSGGRPVAYFDALDGSGFDFNGFVQSGLICHAPRWTADIYDQLKDFYRRPDWQGIMRSYDASHGADVALLRQEAAEKVRRYLNPKPARPQSFALHRSHKVGARSWMEASSEESGAALESGGRANTYERGGEAA